MNKSQRAKFIINALNEAYPETPIPLNHQNVYTLLIAVLLSAQCTDKRVNEVTPKLFALASDPLSMTKLSIDTIYEIIKPCGLGPKNQKQSVIYRISWSTSMIKKFLKRLRN